MIKILEFKERQQNTLQGFVTIQMTNIGLEIRNITVHQKNDSRWIGMPAKPYEKDGKTQYSYIVHFYDKEMGDKFKDAVLQALDEYRRQDNDSLAF
ncbi:MAG: septation protein SpoVG family protein [Candidatus Aminicenantes bacterium]|nr:septation protein SpoVG family protein [Candidatus Aminicenantes bacterium]